MSLTIELSPFEKAQLDAAAEREGLPLEEFARKLVTRDLVSENGHGRSEDPTLALFRQRKAEDARMTPEEVQAENDLFDQFMKNVNETRASMGMRLL